MYNKEHYDHIFYRMKKSIPKSFELYLIIVIVKLYPIFFLVHCSGFTVPPDPHSTVHKYVRYFSLTFFIQNSFGAGSIQTIIGIIFALNLLCVVAIIYYLAISKKVQKIDENYGNINSLGYLFYIFANFVFFKYIILFQYFTEINFLPLLCINNFVDYQKIQENNIFGGSPKETVDGLCNGGNFYIFLVISCLNMLIDLCFYQVITSRFFDFNILSEYKWNFTPDLFLSFEFLESCGQVFFILFLNHDNKQFKLALSFYILVIFVVGTYKWIKRNMFYTADGSIYVYVCDFGKLMSYIACIFLAIFQLGLDKNPNDVNIIGLLIFEGIFVFLLMQFIHRNDDMYIKNVLVSSLQQLNDKNIYSTLIFLIKEFKKFSDIMYKFSDSNLDLFLESYVNHLKICEDTYCPCKNYVKKITGASNTIKSGYTTVINFTHMKKDKQEEYILNKFFNVLAANINNTIKYTNNVNVNNIKDSQRQKLIYQLRIKLITAVKKLLSYKLEKLTKDIDGVSSNQFKKRTKDFIRINFYAMNILCNKSYYKTQFLFFEFLSDYFKRRDRSYHFNLIYYFYLKKFSIKEYNDHLSIQKQGKKEHRGFHLDFRIVLGLCVKYYEIEEKLIKTAIDYEDFIQYFSKDKIFFDKLLQMIKKFKSDYKNVTRYISHYFKNDKINNLFVCTKIILFFKILHFDIPETLHNKLIIQVHDTEENNKVHSYIDSNYYMILNYIHGEFVIKFISHELLIVLEYSEDELRDQDFHVLMPDKLRRLHRKAVINEIKTRATSSSIKEIYFVSKKQTCVLFDIQYKFLLNLRGEITLLTVVNLKKPSKEFRVCFACIDDHGEVLALNREFEEYLVLSMKMLEFVKIDTEKLILQNMGTRMRNFFKDEENTDFIEQFDYELYLSSLFDEEFEILKEKNEKEYRKKFQRWEVLKEMNRKGRYYARYIELNIKQRTLGKEKIYFLKYSVKISLSLRSIEPHSTTLSLIHAVKISKREMAKLSFYRGDEIYESKSEKSMGEEKVNESMDDLFESQSQISSAVSQLKERNSVRLFRQRRNAFKFLPKSRNILILMITIGVLSIISIIYNIVVLIAKTNMYKKTQKYLNLDIDSVFLKKNVFMLSMAMTTLTLVENNIINYGKTSQLPVNLLENLKSAIETESSIMNEVTYNITFLSSQFYNQKIDDMLNEEETIEYIFNNGFIYNRSGTSIMQEINSIKKLGVDMLNKYETGTYDENQVSNILEDYFFKNEISKVQDKLNDLNLQIAEQEMTVYFLMRNLFEKVEPYLEELCVTYNDHLKKNQKQTVQWVTVIKAFEFLIVCLIIGIEWAFIFSGYEKAKKKMIRLRQKVERNNVSFTLKKIEEFVHFSNNFNIGSLYYIADLDLRKVDESSKTVEASNTGSKGYGTLISGMGTPRRKFGAQTYTPNNKDDNFNTPGEQMLKEELRGNSQKSFHEIGIDIDKPPQPEPDGKKNLLKVMHKLDQIKGIKKPKELEKKESEKSKQSNDSSGVYNNENVTNLGGGNFLNHNGSGDSDNKGSVDSDGITNVKGPEPSRSQAFNILKSAIKKTGSGGSNSNGSGEAPVAKLTEPVKSSLKGGGKNVRFHIDDNINLGPNGQPLQHEEDSKIPMIKQNEEGVGLVPKKPARTTKVQFKEKNVRYYSPAQNVNDAVESTNQLKSSKIDRKDFSPMKEGSGTDSNGDPVNMSSILGSKGYSSSIGGKGFHNGGPGSVHFVNPLKNRDKSLLSAINSSNNSLPGMRDMKSRFDPKVPRKMNNSISGLGNDINIDNLKDSQFGKYQLIEQGKAVTVKIKQEVNEKDLTKKEVIEDKIENVIHNNIVARLILNITLGAFLVLYVSSIVLNFIYHKDINHVSEYTHLIFNKTILINMLGLRYQYLVILNEQDENLINIATKAEGNTKDLNDFVTEKTPNVLPSVFAFENQMTSGKSCEYFSKVYSEMFTSNYDDELKECTNVGDQINANGLTKAESYILSTMIVLVEDWKNLQGKEITIEMIKQKLDDSTYTNLISEIEYTFRKYTMILMRFILKDITDIFDSILLNEKIYGYFSICMNVVFLILSLIFIIYPIKSVEMMISWLIHKIMKN